MDEKPVALVLAAAGAVGSAVARRLAAGGYRVEMSGRTEGPLRALAAEIGARAARVDATDEAAVASWVDGIVRETGRVDLVFNAIGLRCAEGGWARPSATLPLRQFLLPVDVIAGAHFTSARAVIPPMTARGTGSIVTLSASLTGQFAPCMPGITAAHAAIEGMTRSLAGELGPRGIRVNCVRAAGMPETRTIQETSAQMRATLGTAGAPAAAPANALRRAVAPGDVAEMVAFLASDRARSITGQVVNVCAGFLV